MNYFSKNKNAASVTTCTITNKCDTYRLYIYIYFRWRSIFDSCISYALFYWCYFQQLYILLIQRMYQSLLVQDLHNVQVHISAILNNVFVYLNILLIVHVNIVCNVLMANVMRIFVVNHVQLTMNVL